jgi:thiamine-phosphate pyrophosphorylase
MFPSPLYAILDPDALAPVEYRAAAAAVLAGGGRLLQLRMKHRSCAEIMDAAGWLRTLTARVGAWLVINDRVDVALAVAADGVHLGAEDLPVAAARRLTAGRLIIGRSTHSLAEARAAVAAGADYVAFGPLFATTTKLVAAAPQGLDRLRELRGCVDVPIVAIGGITEATATAVRVAGADAAAMIGEIAGAADIAAKVRRLLRALRAADART